MEQKREHWGSHFGFVMAAIGSAIGLGILWKFPYVVGENGGGLFLLTYFICTIFVGFPILIAELILGRGAQCAAVGAYAKYDTRGKGWKITGWFGVLSSFLIMSFYSVIAGWGMSYIAISLTGSLQSATAESASALFDTLSSSGEITLFWHLLFTLITMAIVMSGVRKGIEYWVKIMTQVLLFSLVGLFLYALTLEGFGEAAHFIFSPNFENFKWSSIIEALGLSFFTLSIGQGIMISYGSYMKRSEGIVQTAGVVTLSVIVVAILSALMIFPIAFTFGVPPQAGPSLIFKTMPHLFAKLPGSLALSTLFFTLFVFTALTSAIPLIEVVATNLMELIGWSRKKAVLLVGCGTCTFGIPSAFASSPSIFPDWSAIYGMNFLQTIDNLVSIWIIPIGGLLSALFVGRVLDRRMSYGEFGSTARAHALWIFLLRWVIPCAILLIIAQKSGIFDIDAPFERARG